MSPPITAWAIGHTDRFKAVMVGAGVTDLLSFQGANIPSWLPRQEMLAQPYDDQAIYLRCSPITYAARMRTPTLIVVDLFRAGEASEQGHFAVAEYRMEDRLPQVRCPALLLYGRDDPFASPDRAAQLKAAFRPAREGTIPAGIFAANEAPGLFAEAVLDYLHGAP